MQGQRGLRADELLAPFDDSVVVVEFVIIRQDERIESGDVIGRVGQGVQRLLDAGAPVGTQTVGVGYRCGRIVTGQMCVGVGQRVEVGDIQPRGLFDDGHQGVHIGRIAVGGQADQKVTVRIRLFHLVERALCGETGQSAC